MPFALRLVVVAALAAAAVVDARAAESYDSCAGTITAIPATITTQGTWCLKADKAWSLTSGAMITVATNNVTIDCNHFKLGGTGGGDATTAIGIQAIERANITVRNCNIRGFGQGIVVSGAGATVEDNLLDRSRSTGIAVSADGGVVRRNRVIGTGLAATPVTIGILAARSTDVVDNLVDGVDGATPFGIYVDAPSQGVIDGNRVRGVVATSAGTGIHVDGGSRMLVRGNHVLYGTSAGAGPSGSLGIACNDGARVTAIENTTAGWPIDCPVNASNVSL
jgi:hypothetical protein